MSVVRRFEIAFNKQDVDGLVACFTEGATYTDTFFGAHIGHPALRAMFGRMFREGRDYAWRMETVVEDARHVAAEWSFSYVATEAVPRSAGKRVQFRGMSLFVLAQLGFAPEAVAKVLRKRL